MKNFACLQVVPIQNRQSKCPLKQLPILLFIFLACLTTAYAQKKTQTPAVPPARTTDFIARPEGNGTRLEAILPPLSQVAGAPAAFWATYWEFGDGGFAFGSNPEHVYPSGGEYEVYLAATNNYDDGKPPTGKKKKIKPKQAYADAGTALPDVFDPKQQQSIALRVNRDPAAEEELTGIISYRNNSKLTTDGEVHLFFNEKAFKSDHFTFQESRTHFGEQTEVPTTGFVAPMLPDWPLSLSLPGTGESMERPVPFAPERSVLELLEAATQQYRASKVWHFSGLKPGEKRNLFVTLVGTAKMLADTNAFIHLQVVFAPKQPAAQPEAYTLEMEIVNSHDPNRISVSDRRANFRGFKRKDLGYQIRFQNNGEGPARTVQLSVNVPKGMKKQALKVESWYPECPICPETPSRRSCLDTAFTEEGLVFTFRNIYLPGSRQKNVADYDSTKGFVKYRIASSRQVAKKALSSRAEIVFDQNPPIRTNRSQTRFKMGLSPGIKGGYQFRPDSLQNGTYFVGLTLSTYKSYKVYPQLELLAGIPGAARLSSAVSNDTSGVNVTQPGTVIEIDTFWVTQRKNDFRTQLRQYEVAALLRKNVSNFWGLGAGLSARLSQTEVQTQFQERVVQYLARQKQIFKKEVLPELDKDGTETTHTSHVDLMLIGDLTLGWVRAGLNIGLRGGYPISGGGKGFLQASVEYKF